jgi:Notch-like protein
LKFVFFIFVLGAGSHASTSQGTPSSVSSPSTVTMSPLQHQQMSQQSFYQYLTPPSQHSGGVTPQHLVQTLDSYPTPSPESPGHWSSSSPHSTSDWSEGVQSPANNVYVPSTGHQSNKGSEAIYI